MRKRVIQGTPPKGHKTRQKSRKISWTSFGWWSRTPLSAFSSLLAFANEPEYEIKETNWENILWKAMGRERMCLGTSRKSVEGSPMRLYATDIGDGSDFDNIRPHLPQILGQEATLPLTKDLHKKIRQVLDRMFAKSRLVDRQRRGEDEAIWKERAKQRDMAFRLTGYPSNYSQLPWDISHFEEYEEILDLIKDNLKVSEARKAIIHCSVGFVRFEDEREDAAITLGWMSMGLAHVIFEKERVVIRKCGCRSCLKYFIHETLKTKRYCSDKCRSDSRHKGSDADCA